ncbi:ABC transporter substrate-binding protein [Marinobacterium aestuariivivens]|uniref:ABC transporter substrate-binding protein n=1 Tax=Marinobacterium aestuariivivens TaxID=1698799 RepID=A0ABW2A875_9GAMM
MRKTILSVAMSLAVGLTAASQAKANTLRIAESSDIASLDAYSVTESSTIAFLHHVYEPLVRYNDRLELEPALATAWETVEPTVWRFHLRDGVTFHNGNPFDADDVVASIKRVLDAPIKVNVPTVVDARRVDDLTVDIVLSKPDPLLLNYLTNVYLFDNEWMIEHDALKTANVYQGEENYATTHANGTGPFKLKSRQPDAKTVLEVNPGWWDNPKHNLTEIVFTPIASDATRVAALLSGEIDLMRPAPLQDISRIEAMAGVRAMQSPSLRTILLGLRQGQDELLYSDVKGRNPMSDLRVRKALYQAINIDLIRQKIMRGQSRNATLVVAPEVPGFDPARQRHSYDPAAARALLAEAGYPDGFRVGMDCPNNHYVNDDEICQAIVSMWAKVGVEASLNAQGKSTYFEKVLQGDADIYMLGWATLPMLDSYSALSAFLTTKTEKLGIWNVGQYSNARVDEITEQVAGELDQGKRLALMNEALGIVSDEVAVIPLHQQPLSWG